ncbi:MAG TPA: hypothetical protein VFY23_13730 [Candidatus Limnocylindrales bacterium]|nr:hypothetical protein [Candidatus Limnocylindrales bacterium]
MDRPLARTASLVAEGTLDAELASLLALLVGAGVPVVVAGPVGPARALVVDAAAELLPPDVRVVELAGPAEEFEWLPEATELGWRREHNVVPASGRDATSRASAGTTVLVVRDLAGEGPGATAGARARLVVRSLSVGYGLLAEMDGPDLEAVLNRLATPDIGTDEDERSRLGAVLAVADVAAGPRVLAAHYVRPLARDQHGHLQRMPPAVLATWSMGADAFDHFAWGVIPELAARIGLRPLELEREQARIAAALRREAAAR